MSVSKVFRDEIVEIDPSLFPGVGPRLLGVGVLEDLLGSKGPQRLRRFVERWQPFLPTVLYRVDQQENLRMARDMRRIIQALIGLVHSFTDVYAEDTPELKGVHIGPGSPTGETAIVNIAFESRTLANYIENVLNKVPGPSGSKVLADSAAALEVGPDGELPIMQPTASFEDVKACDLGSLFLAAPDLPEDPELREDTYRSLTMHFELPGICGIDSSELPRAIVAGLFNYLFLGCGVHYRLGRRIHFVPDIFSGLVILLSEVLDESTASLCKVCNEPMLAPRKGGSKKVYCSEPCRQTFLKSQKFCELVRVDGFDPDAAARVVRIKRERAEKVVDRNSEEFDEYINQLLAEREAETGSGEEPADR